MMLAKQQCLLAITHLFLFNGSAFGSSASYSERQGHLLRGLSTCNDGSTPPSERPTSPDMDWSILSPILSDPSLLESLPTVPSKHDAHIWYGAATTLSKGESYILSSFPSATQLCSPIFAASRAGPSHDCSIDGGCSGVSGRQCRATINANSILLKGKLGTYWAKNMGTPPAWAQFTFPSVQDNGSTSFELQFTMDSRYRPELYGGNACAAASPTHNCTLCTTGPWDYSIPPGIHVLWSSTERNNFLVTGPYDVREGFDNRAYTQTIAAPSDFVVPEGEYPVVTFLIFSQYQQYGELDISPGDRCSVAYSNQGGHSYKDKSFMVKSVSLSYQETNPPPVHTDWTAISPLLLDESLTPTLPTVPSQAQASSLYAGTQLISGTSFTLSNFQSEAKLCDDSVFAAVRGGPSHDCSCHTGTCSGVSGVQCRATINSNSILLKGKLGTYWAKNLGSPAWAQFTFPPVQDDGANQIEFQFTLDRRYRPEMYGGNACEAASDTFFCNLCITSVWDHSVPPGIHVLWSAAGRDDFLVTGPFDVREPFDNRQYTQTIQAPSELTLSAGEQPVVTLFMFSQYQQYGEQNLSPGDRCSVAHSNEGGHSYKDKSFMVNEVSIAYRGTDDGSDSDGDGGEEGNGDGEGDNGGGGGNGASSTNWSSISAVLLEPEVVNSLPGIPSAEDAMLLYPNTESTDNTPFRLHSISNLADHASLCDDSGISAVRGGPLHDCESGYCSGVSGHQCRLGTDRSSIVWNGKLGTYWAKAIGTPAWAQFTFPPVPEASTEFVFRFTMDDRYRPELNGGNACSAATEEHDCQLCTVGPWDHSVGAGVFVLWSAAGRDEFVIMGPFDVQDAWDRGGKTQTLVAPEELALQPGEYPVVTMMTFSQYGARGEVLDPSRCSVAESTEGQHASKNKAFMVHEVALMYRSISSMLKEPASTRPRLYGTNAEWMSAHVEPFLDIPCDSKTVSGAGWFEEKGYISIKNHFELAAKGYASCDGGTGSEDIGYWGSISPYFDNNGSPQERDGYRALHLLRRQWACAEANSGSFAICEFDELETDRLATAVAVAEMNRFDQTTWSCGRVCGGNGNPAFDLTTAERVSYFVHLYDVLASHPQEYLPQPQAVRIAETLLQQIDLFMATFWNGDWQLWNGNNWTPHLCVAAMQWAIVFWHEENAVAREVVRIVEDIMWLHRHYYTEDGVYVEGVGNYAFMSIGGQMTIAVLSKASFGVVPQALDPHTLRKTADYMLSSMSTDGYLVDFGDSHRVRGWTEPLLFIEATLAPTILADEPLGSSDLTSTQTRAFAASLYGSGGLYSNPWRIYGHTLVFDSLLNARAPPQYITQPLGGERIEAFAAGGYAMMISPLLDASYEPVCFADLCLDGQLPSLADNIPYSSLAVQARANTYAHSESDFATFTWSAWGTRLISEFGYGTIATAVLEQDMRRYSYLDNNPAGHNTVVVRQAYAAGSETVNFSQLNFVKGSMSTTTVGDRSCVLVDGSEPYGSARPDGWLDVMKRYFCQLDGGAYLIVDVLQVKENRQALSLVGAVYGGPDFDEPTASQSLDLDEYFYLDTAANIDVTDGEARELPFERSSSKWCNHVSAEILDGGTVSLTPECGIGAWRRPDGLGTITGISVGPGQGSFVYDGLITTVNTWLEPHALKKRRIRFVSDQQVGTDGDVRLFVLSPSTSGAADQIPHTKLENCSAHLGCVGSFVQCSCIQLCVGTTLEWAVITNSALAHIGIVGSCDSIATSIDSSAVESLRAMAGLP